MWTRRPAWVVCTAVYLASGSCGQLVPFTYDALPLGSIKAGGWLQDQLQLAADGLAGHEHDFYRFAKDTTWTGGTVEYSTLHESSPYWFNYIVPLAFTLNDTRLKSQAKWYLDYVLDHQAADGWLGPETTHETRGIWARSLLLMGLTQYAEADPTETDRIVDSMLRFIKLTNTMLKDNYTGLIEHGDDTFDPDGFGVSRTHELPMSFQWIYDNHPNGNESLLLETMELMFAGGRQGGYDWSTWFVPGVFPEVGTPELKELSMFTHGVNTAEGFRYLGVLYRLNGNESLIQQSKDAINMTFTYHGSASGTILADEMLAGLNPQRGSELCTAAETVFSLHWLHRMFGDNYYADRAELAAFNAFPAAVSADWWSHQYMAQPNQPWSRNLTQTPFQDVNAYGNTFSLEPNYPCCTVNHPQTYPKFTAASYVRKGTDGLVHALLSPATVSTTLGNGTNPVTVTSDTIYPFGDTITYTITAAAPFDFYVRVPSWATNASSIRVGNGTAAALTPSASSLQHVRAGAGTTTATVTLGMAVAVEPRAYVAGSVAVHRGPLLYALDVAYTVAAFAPTAYNTQQPLPANETTPQARDHAYDPTSEWRVALDPAGVRAASAPAGADTTALPSPIWDRDAPPVWLTAPACVVAWGNDTGTASPPPQAPACLSDVLTAKLIPYGAAKLRIADFPTVALA